MCMSDLAYVFADIASLRLQGWDWEFRVYQVSPNFQESLRLSYEATLT